MKIISEEWKPTGSNEAIVILKGGEFTIAAFSHPYSKFIGEIISDDLHIYDCQFIGRSANETESIRRIVGSLEHEMTVVVRDRAEGIITVGDIRMKLECDIPADINEGELVDVVCTRIDLW